MRIAWFTQTSPTSLSGETSRRILPYLASKTDIEVFTDSFDEFDGYQTHHYLAAFQRHTAKPFDLHFYQVENGASGHFIRSALGLHPGVTLFHDLLMTDFGPDPLTNSPWSAVIDSYLHGAAWPKRFTEFPRKNPAAEREIGLSLLPLFSSIRNRVECKRGNFLSLQKGDSYYLPLPVKDCGAIECTDAPSVLHIGFCGSPRIEHRAHKVLHAIHHSRIPYKLFWLIEGNERAQVNALLEEFKIGSFEIIEGRSPEAWQLLQEKIHLGIHTLFSVFGTTGFFLPQTLMAGKAAIVTRFAESENLPAEVAFQVDPGETESAQISLVLQKLHEMPQLLQNGVGRSYARETHAADLVAQELHSILKLNLTHLKERELKWNALEHRAHEDLVRERFECFEEWGAQSLQRAFDELGWR